MDPNVHPPSPRRRACGGRLRGGRLCRRGSERQGRRRTRRPHPSWPTPPHVTEGGIMGTDVASGPGAHGPCGLAPGRAGTGAALTVERLARVRKITMPASGVSLRSPGSDHMSRGEPHVIPNRFRIMSTTGLDTPPPCSRMGAKNPSSYDAMHSDPDTPRISRMAAASASILLSASFLPGSLAANLASWARSAPLPAAAPGRLSTPLRAAAAARTADAALYITMMSSPMLSALARYDETCEGSRPTCVIRERSWFPRSVHS